MADKPTTPLEKVIQTAIDSALKEVHTCLPAVVTRVNNSDQLIDAQVTIKRKLAGELVDLPLLVDVPLRFMRSKSFSMTIPIEVDDHVMIICAERSIDTWLEGGGIKNPSDIRKFTLSDAFAIPFMYSQNEKISGIPDDEMQIRTNTGLTRISFTEDETIRIEADKSVDVIAPKVTVTSPDIDIVSQDIDVSSTEIDVKSTNMNALLAGILGVAASAVNITAAATTLTGALNVSVQIVTPSIIINGIESKNHKHYYTWTDPGGSGLTGIPQ